MQPESSIPPIPLPMLKQVENETNFPHFSFDKMGKGKFFYDVIVCKATFAIEPGVLKAAAEQKPIEYADQFWDEANLEGSSLKAAGDVLLFKPSTDVLITGKAYAPNSKSVTGWLAGVRISSANTDSARQKPIVEHTMQLWGPRYWTAGLLGGWQLTKPVATKYVEIRHELAYGGRYYEMDKKTKQTEWIAYKKNPSGCGFVPEKYLSKDQNYKAPQIEPPNQSTQVIGTADIDLACPAPIPRFWDCRTQYAGTYDEAWERQFDIDPIPDYPRDFDYRFFQCAIQNLITPEYLVGDERLNLAGLVQDAPDVVVCQLPNIRMKAELITMDGRSITRAMNIDTLHIDLDTSTVSVTWRLALDQRECIEKAMLFNGASSNS
jgi:hypothetical protein